MEEVEREEVLQGEVPSPLKKGWELLMPRRRRSPKTPSRTLGQIPRSCCKCCLFSSEQEKGPEAYRAANGAFTTISRAAVGERFTGDWRAHHCSHPDDLGMSGIRWVGRGWRRRKFPAGETGWIIVPLGEIRNCTELQAGANGGKQPPFQVLC